MIVSISRRINIIRCIIHRIRIRVFGKIRMMIARIRIRIIHRIRMRMIIGRIRISRMIIFRCTSVSRDNLSETRDGRRESEAVIHGTSYNHT